MKGKLIAFAIALLGIATIGVVQLQAQAETIDTGRDCDKYAVIKCGAHTMSELRTEYDTLNVSSSNGSTTKQSDIPAIFTALGISRSDLNGYGERFETGVVYQNGNVVVNGKTVAKNAVMGARYLGGTSISGSSTGKVVSVSQMGSAQEAIVKFDEFGRFDYAVMTPCANPVKATNVVPTPEYKCDSLKATTIDRTTRKFTTAATAENGAKVKSYVYDFGDSTTKTVNSTSTSNSVSHNYSKPGTYTAKVTVHFTVGFVEKTSTCTTSVTVDEEQEPNVDIEKLVNGQKDDVVEVGEEFTYSIKVTNNGNVELKDVVVSDEAPAGVTFKSADKGTIADNVWTYEVASLAAGDSFTVDIVAVMDEYVEGTITNKACVETPTVPGEECDTATVESPRVDITKYVNGMKEDEVVPGTPFEYDIVVRNTGSVDLKDVTVTDEAPAGITFQSADKGTVTDNVWTYEVASLATGDSFTATITAVADEAFTGDKVNTACVDSSTITGNPDDCDDATVTTKIQVCDTETDKIVWVKPSEAEDSRYTTDLAQCDNVEVCDPETGDIITVSKNDEDEYENVNSDSCKVKVCEISTGEIIKVDKADQDNEGYADVDDEACNPVPPTTPPVTELPETGLANVLNSVVGLGSLTAATYYYLASRRS